MTPDEFERWKHGIPKDKLKEDHIEALADMILEGKEEEELALALKKILNWVDEGNDKYEYGLFEILDPIGDNAIQERLNFLMKMGKDGWILCTEVSFHDPLYGRCTRYTFRKRKP
jgi:hypothetical protein